jgi:cadmium resistance protein CadD (predicted permease)
MMVHTLALAAASRVKFDEMRIINTHIFFARFSMSEALSSVCVSQFLLFLTFIGYAVYVDVEMAFTNTDAYKHH